MKSIAWERTKYAVAWLAVAALLLDDLVLGGPCFNVDCPGDRSPMADTVFVVAVLVLIVCVIWWIANRLQRWMDGPEL
ncbi:hypothetical protein OJ997_04605 [Solirubrobacter phytolaccae]|uniref:Uncharacterized protein n=1 Tax=Solirubrobacter phytolaccae TaxID=1404360 RepID=A0A9X3N4Y3_9ACTN|nr:hypothetical protein [Solirubrobacter phytolaccae]MDA0179566.1 hypothetical protein [Solirubrobacter phytolaccae]